MGSQSDGGEKNVAGQARAKTCQRISALWGGTAGKEPDMKTNQYLIDFYSHYDRDSRLSPKHGMVEFLTTMRYVERYIKPGIV